MASRIGLLLMSLLLIFKGIDLTSGKKCKFEHKYICGIQDCNCRYVSENGVSVSSLYRRFLAMFTDSNDGSAQVCDKCDVFCSKEKHINCEHGSCDKQKGCICRDCWTGETCSKYDNRQPQFKQLLYVAEIKEDTSVGDEILKVSAVDHDLETCVDKYNCPCGRVKYSINDGDEDEFFNINPDSGVISLNKKLDGQYHDPISFTILAKNEEEMNTVEENQSNKGLATVVITSVASNVDRLRQRRSLHHRTRRSVNVYNALEATFEPVTNKTYFSAGCIIPYRLYLVQNSSASPETLNSISIKLSSENLLLSDTGVSVNISNANVGITNTSIHAGAVEVSVNGSLLNDGYMEIKFDAIVPATSNPLALLQVAFTMNATASGSVTYGPKYSPELYTSYPEIKFARTMKGDVEVETTLYYDVNITLPYFNFTFVFEITTIVNKFRFLSIESAETIDISNSVQAQNQNPTPMLYTGVDDNITSRVVLDFGNIKVLNSDQNANTMKLKFAVKVNDHQLLENASTHWVGTGVNAGEEMLWVGQDSITFSKDEPYLIAQIESLNTTNPTRYYINDILRFSWSVKHAENGSYEDARSVIVSFYFSPHLDWVDNGGESGLATNGNTQTTTEDGRTVLTYTYTANSGTLGKADILTGIIEAGVKDTVTPLADLNVEIKIGYTTSKGENRPVRTYKPNPGYLAGVPLFNVSSNAPGRLINIGQLVDITINIVVSKITLEGKLYAILPVANSSAIMRFVRHESFSEKTYGSNIQAPSLSSSVANFNSTNDSEYYDRAEIELGQVSNTDVALISAGENTLTLMFRVVLEDNDYVMNKSNYKIGVGVKGSEHMIWISQMTFIANVLQIRRPRLLIQAYSNASDSLVQGSIVEYNFTISHKENSDAHAIEVEVVWMLPVYTKFLQVNKKSDHPISQRPLGNNVAFKLNRLDFGETPYVSFSVALDPDKTVTKSGKSFAVTPVALTYKNKAQIYYEPLVPMSVNFKVPEKPIPRPPNAVTEFYQKGFLIDNSSSAIYICSVSSKRNKPSCFWTNTKGSTWRAVDVMVISIIGIDNANKMVYGVGNNMISYMKYIPDKGKWYSISSDQWEQAKSTLSDKEVVKIEESDADDDVPAIEKQKHIENGEKWGATKTGVFHFSGQNPGWKRKALWNSCN